MLLRITKNYYKPHIILYLRDDGTASWMYADDFFVRHDLSHYCLEKHLGYTTAFMGMLNKGMDIKDFEDRNKRSQMLLTKEALYAENMANLFLMEIAQKNLRILTMYLNNLLNRGIKNLPRLCFQKMK